MQPKAKTGFKLPQKSADRNLPDLKAVDVWAKRHGELPWEIVATEKGFAVRPTNWAETFATREKAQTRLTELKNRMEA